MCIGLKNNSIYVTIDSINPLDYLDITIRYKRVIEP